jgi:hypothetical protein
MTPTNQETELYSNISEIRDTLDALLKRGKPVSVADLQVLVAKVEVKSRPTINLGPEKVAAELAPMLLPLLPTPTTLAQVGEQAAARMEAAIKAGTAASVQQVLGVMQQLVASVQESARQGTAAAAEYRTATAAAPRSLPVSFTDGWRLPVGIMVATAVVVLLISGAFGAFRGVDQAKYNELMRVAEAIQNERDAYRDQVRTFRQDMSKGKDARATTKLVKQYFPPIGADTVAAK